MLLSVDIWLQVGSTYYYILHLLTLHAGYFFILLFQDTLSSA